MTPIEIIAFILILAGLTKIAVILINPSSWMGFAKKIWNNPNLVSGISLILGAVVLYYLLQELSIVQILATAALISLLIAMNLSKHVSEILKIYEKQIKNKSILKEYWLPILIWAVLMIWGLKELFI